MFNIDKSKSINSLIYIIKELKKRQKKTDLHKVMKLLYFADREHLVKYGFPISGDTYLKQTFGPVPSFMNYVAKNEQHDFKGCVDIKRKGRVSILSTKKDVDLDDLSQSEIEALNFAISNFSDYTFEELTEISHDYAWTNSDWEIDYLKIAIEGNASEDIIAFIKQNEINNKISFL
ncbi:Panacea domain-containing protein [uncultured Chryseobacterium sp.]|uniref:Panacea domain-containing protein n=1 Tax=uncultured Chryseobacterium sp. TaxID=259322 RepID=UPI0025D46508|nr:Panacea domain-containing protein [uncultured Chryseobacterium sp.]